MSLRDSMMARLQQMMQQRQQQDATALETARTQPIPGFTGPTSTGQIPGVGMAPPQQPIPGVPPQPFLASGPYGQQALQLSGLLGNHMMPGNIQTQQGLLGAPPKGFRLPFYRPPGK
jgi:hypothetical protein